jgi:MFS family permease
MCGKNKMLLIVGIYSIAISIAAISTSFTVMIITRIIQGIGAKQVFITICDSNVLEI